MNIDELWEKYSVEKFVKDSKLPFRLMDKIGFTEAIGEIISNPVEAEVSQENGGQIKEIFNKVEELLDICTREEAVKNNCGRCKEYYNWKDSRFSG